MRKIILLTMLLVSTTVWSANSATVVHFNDNSSISVQASVNNINRIFVKDDKIVQHVAPQGTFIFDKQLSKDGSLYFKPLYSNMPITIFFATEKGHHFSALVMPVDENGKTVELIPNNVTAQDVRWEKNDGYLSLLETFTKGMVQDAQLKGVTAEAVHAKPFHGYPDTKMELVKVYQGGLLEGFVYKITNTSNHPVQLFERKFWRTGVRSVSLSQQELKPKQTGFVYAVMGADHP